METRRHKIFVSYKYADNTVQHLDNTYNTTVRDYVDRLQDHIENIDGAINKGEKDDEDLSKLTDDTIWEKLKDRIYDSTLTIVMISPNMKEEYKSERNQWIPQEISYSLKSVSRKNRAGNMVTSAPNAIIAVVLPDITGRYDYYIQDNNCCNGTCTQLNTFKLFTILKENMFNEKKPNVRTCQTGDIIYRGEPSYILSVKWCDFIKNSRSYIERAYLIQNSIERYDMHYEVE